MMCPATPELLAIYLPTVGVDIDELPARVLESRRDQMGHLRSIREFQSAERWGWLTLAGVVLGVSGVVHLDEESGSAPLRVLEPLGPVHVETKIIPGIHTPIEVVTDSEGEALFDMACATTTTLMVSGRPVATNAVHDDIRSFISGMVAA